jgi:hypothetical protein
LDTIEISVLEKKAENARKAWQNKVEKVIYRHERIARKWDSMN